MCGAWRLTREIELGNARCEDVSFPTPTSVRWNLPVSKADAKALGAARSHECACGKLSGLTPLLPEVLCSACALRAHVLDVRASLGSDAPLFPNRAGAHPPKQAVIQTIRSAATRLGLPLKTPSGAQAWGGHALRRGVARYLAAAGVEIWRVQALARHSSSAILGYLDNSHIVSTGRIASEAAAGTRVLQLQDELRVLQDRVALARRNAADCLRPPLPADQILPPQVSALSVPTELEDVLPTPPPPASTPVEFELPYVLGARLHKRDTRNPSYTECRWKWEGTRSASLRRDWRGAGLLCIERSFLSGEGFPEAPVASSSSSDS